VIAVAHLDMSRHGSVPNSRPFNGRDQAGPGVSGRVIG